MKKILATTLTFWMLAWVGSAMATPVTFDFTNGLETYDTSSADFWGSDGTTMLTASATPEDKRNLYLGTAGLGVYAEGDYANGENYQVDGWGIQESILFTFESNVTLLSATFGHVGSNDDFTLFVNDAEVLQALITPQTPYVFENLWISDNFEFKALEKNDDFYIASITVDNAPVPEPTTMLLFGTGLLGLVSYNRKRLTKKS
jgi:hypothetical protein